MSSTQSNPRARLLPVHNAPAEPSSPAQAAPPPRVQRLGPSLRARHLHPARHQHRRLPLDGRPRRRSAESRPSSALIHYGANDTWLVLHHQWYRLLTATFVHVGLLHIATNMWCLWNLGILGEPLLGPFGLVAVYILTGIAGNLLSLA